LKGTKLEKLILGHILIDPAILKDLDITKYFFSLKKLQSIFEEIRTGNTDPVLISKKLKFNNAFSYVSSLMDGIPRADAKNIPIYINETLSERFKLKAVKLIDEGSKTGFFDDEKLKDLYDRIKDLEAPKDKYTARLVSDFESRPISWFWYNKIPSGSLSFLVGDPGAGKSLLSLKMAALVSMGADWPDVKLAPGSKPGSVIILTAEDNISDTVKVRLEEMGADCSKITIFEGILSNKSEYFDVRLHLDLLDKEIKRLADVKLIIFDPITAYMGGTEGNQNIQVRAALAPLKDLAESNKLTILGINHMNKDQAKKALYRTMGSVAFTAAARATWLVALDEEDQSNRRRFFVPLQTNTCKNPTTLAFSVDGPIGRPSVSFEPTSVDVTADELLADEETKERTSARIRAKEFLREALKDGRVESGDLKEWAILNNIAPATWDRAKKLLKIKCYQEDKKWWMELEE